MKQDKEKYLVISKYEDIDEKCSGCSNAGIEIKKYSNKSDVVRKIAEVSQYANIKIIGIYEKIDKLMIDKYLNVELVKWPKKNIQINKKQRLY